MGCATSHSEDLHKTSLLESDKFVTSLQDVPGYFNRTIHTADFLPPKFVDGEPEKTEMSYTGPPSHLRNSVDFHPYWHLLQEKDYIPGGETILEGDVPPSLLPSTTTAQELRDIEVREAISDLRARVRESISSKLKEDEEEYFAALSSSAGEYERGIPHIGGQQPPPPPLPKEDYMDDSLPTKNYMDESPPKGSNRNDSGLSEDSMGHPLPTTNSMGASPPTRDYMDDPEPRQDYMDGLSKRDSTNADSPGMSGVEASETDVADSESVNSPLAQDEKETIDFLDSVINESMSWDEDNIGGAEGTVGGASENSNWSFTTAPPPPTSEVDTMDHGGGSGPHGNQHNKPLPGVNLAISGSNKSSPINSPTSFNKSVYLPEERSSFISNEVLARQMDAGAQIRSPDRSPVPREEDNRRLKGLPKQKSVPQPQPRRTGAIVRTNSAKAEVGAPLPPVGELLSGKPLTAPPTELPPSPPPPPSQLVKDTPVRTNGTAPRSNNKPQEIITRADVHTGPVPPPPGYGSPIPQSEESAQPSPIPRKSVAPTPHPRPLQSTKSLDRRDSKKAPVPLPTSASSASSPLQKTGPLDGSEPPEEAARSSGSGHDAGFLEKTKSLDRRRNSSPKGTPPPPAPRPKQASPPGIKPKPARHSMIELPSETMILEDLPSDDSGIREEGSERGGVHYIIRNLQMTDSKSSTLDRRGKGLPPPTSKKPARPVSMPPNAFGPPVVKPKPTRKPAASNGVVPNGRGGVSRTASFGQVKRSVSDDASSVDSGLHMKEDTTDILSQIYVGIPEGQVR